MSETMKIFEIIPEAARDLTAVFKRNQGTQYSGQSIDDIKQAISPIFAKHKITMTTTALDINREERTTQKGNKQIYTVVKMMYKFYTTDGSCIETTTYGEAFDSGDKSTSKAQTYALKEALQQVFLICVYEKENIQNNDNISIKIPQFATTEQVQKIHELCKSEVITDVKALLDYYSKKRGSEIKNIESMTISEAEHCIKSKSIKNN